MADQKQVESVYMEKRVFHPTEDFVKNAHLKSMEEYEKLWKKSIEEPDTFWAEKAEEFIDWFKKWDTVEEYSFKDDIYIKY